MRDMIDKLLSLGMGLAVVSKEQVEKLVDELVKRGEMAPAEAKKMAAGLMEKGREEKEQFIGFVRKQMKSMITELGVVTKDDLTPLLERMRFLEERVKRLEPGAGEQ